MDPDGAQRSHNAVASINSPDPAPADISYGDLPHNILSDDQRLHEATVVSTNASDPSPVDSSNNLPPAHSSPDSLAIELEEARSANLDLVEQVSSLRDALSDKKHMVESMQTQLHVNLGRIEELNSEIFSLKVQNGDHAETASCLAQEGRTLHAELVNLRDESLDMNHTKKSLDGSLQASRNRLDSLLIDLSGKKAATAGVQAQVHMICFEVQKLQLENEEYLKEVSALHAGNEAMVAQVVQMQQEERDLSDELQDNVAELESTREQVCNLEDRIRALTSESLKSKEDTKDLLHQLDEVKPRLSSLEASDKAMALEEAKLVARIQGLKNQLHTLRASIDTTHLALDKDKAKGNSSRTREIACLKGEADEGDVGTLRSATQMQVEISDPSQQHLQNLESQVAALRTETQSLVHSNEELKDMLLQQRNETAVSIKLQEDVKKLEGFLNEAEEKAQALKRKEVELKWKLQELTISASKKPRLGGLITPLVISGATIVVLGLVIHFWHSEPESK